MDSGFLYGEIPHAVIVMWERLLFGSLCYSAQLIVFVDYSTIFTQ